MTGNLTAGGLDRTRADALVAEASSGWLGSIDRSAIGYLAVPFEALAIVGALDIAKNTATHDDVPMIVLHELLVELAGGGEAYNSLSVIAEAEIEFGFWYSVHYGDFKPGFVFSLNQWSMMRLWMLDKAYEDSDRLPYFEAGLEDVEFIDRCIADGIDTELAVSMMRNSTA